MFGHNPLDPTLVRNLPMNKAGIFGLKAMRIQPMVQVKEQMRKHKRRPIWNYER